jgi:excinuclease ABC subunit B
MPELKTAAAYVPTGDQPAAIEKLAEGLTKGERYQTLLGATGTGKTATMAWIIEEVQKPALIIAHNTTLAAQLCNEFREFFPQNAVEYFVSYYDYYQPEAYVPQADLYIEKVQRPTLVLAHNKTLAAQLANEFRELMPNNAVEYFVSYYDYYQPEAYVPQADLYIEKDSSRNDDIDRLRHSASSNLLSRRDVIVVASVSCIYGLGSPEEYKERVVFVNAGEEQDRDLMLRKLIDIQYVRNDTLLGRGRFRVKGDVVEVQPAYSETAYRITFFGDLVEAITHFDPLTGEVLSKYDQITIFPATQYVTSKPTIERALDEIKHELSEQVKQFEAEGKLLEAHRIRQRTEYDMEMMKELGFCNGIENYSRILDGRPPGSAPHTLLDYFPKDFVVFVDESHQTVPQVGGMYEGDRSRKQTLVDFGFRLPSALDNRPLRFDEFLAKVPQLVFVSATPGSFELRNSKRVAEQLIRPTGLVDPEVELRPTKNQIDDLLGEIRKREQVGERTLVTTLTKKMSEDLTDYLLESGIKARYLHSEIDTLERIQIIRELRLGEYDVLVGVNLLREGLDLPEVSLVAILDADKEGFLRGRTSLIQTIGRAARHINGRVLMYADKQTEAIKDALDETNRRRTIQLAYNEEHGITPETIQKGVSDIAEFLSLEQPTVPSTKRRRGRKDVEGLDRGELEKLVIQLEEEMFAAAEELRFEYAAKLRDEIKEIRRELSALTAV